MVAEKLMVAENYRAASRRLLAQGRDELARGDTMKDVGLLLDRLEPLA